MPDLYLQILFPQAADPADLEILRQASAKRPGQARLLTAVIGKADPGAPNSLPLLSSRGGKIGFVASRGMMEPPYNSSYVIE